MFAMNSSSKAASKQQATLGTRVGVAGSFGRPSNLHHLGPRLLRVSSVAIQPLKRNRKSQNGPEAKAVVYSSWNGASRVPKIYVGEVQHEG